MDFSSRLRVVALPRYEFARHELAGRRQAGTSRENQTRADKRMDAREWKTVKCIEVSALLKRTSAECSNLISLA